MRRLARLVLELAFFLAGLGAAAAQTCPAAPWRRLPLATKPASVAQLDIAQWLPYVRSSLIPHVVGAAIALVIAIVFLLSFLLWRLVKCCTCCACVRGPQLSGKKARRSLAGTGARVLKAAVLLVAVGALAAGVWGVTQVDSGLVKGGLDAVDAVTAFVTSAVDAGQAAVTAVQALDAQLQAVKTNMQGLGPALAPAVAPYIQAIDDTHSQLSSFADVSTGLDDIKSSVVNKINDAKDQYSPLAQTIDKWRVIALYIIFSLLAGLAVLVAVGSLVDWPAFAKPLVLILLILLILTWVVVVALTAVLRVGNDVCVNVEAKVLDLAAGMSLGGGAGSAATLINYYLTGQGGDVLAILKDVMGVDIAASLDQAQTTLQDIQAAVDGTPLLAAALSADMQTVQDRFNDVTASVDALTVALSYAAFHPVWVAVKGYVCCTVLNSFGATWAGLIATGSCCLALMLLAFIWIGRMDSLSQLGCCHIYSLRDYTLEGEGDGSQQSHDCGGGAGLQQKRKQAAEFDVLASCSPPSPTIMARKEAPAAFPPPATVAASADYLGGSIKASQQWSPAGGKPPGSPGAGSAGNRTARLYPDVATGNELLVAPSAAGAGTVPSDEELRQEAERAAKLAGQAYSMASQAQSLLDIVARSTSNLSTSGQLSPHASPARGTNSRLGTAGGMAPLGSPGSDFGGSPFYSAGQGSPQSPAGGYGGGFSPSR